MDWKEAIKACVEACVRDKNVDVVLSPDVDGVVAFYLLRRYLAQTGRTATIVGQYDSKTLYLYEGVETAKHALFLDLDVHFTPHCIGQHVIGNVKAPPGLYFNPNRHFDVRNYASKFPFGTCHLMLWALFPDEGEVLRSPEAEALLWHADSAYANARKYKPNATAWARGRLFPGVAPPPSLARAVDGSYFQTHLRAHANVVNRLRGNVRPNGKEGGEWDAFAGLQSCASRGAVGDLVGVCEEVFDGKAPTVSPASSSKPPGRTVWTGELRRIQRHLVKDMAEYAAKYGVVSHAIVNTRVVSMTFGETPAQYC
jgi:hypothetical protein